MQHLPQQSTEWGSWCTLYSGPSAGSLRQTGPWVRPEFSKQGGADILPSL